MSSAVLVCGLLYLTWYCPPANSAPSSEYVIRYENCAPKDGPRVRDEVLTNVLRKDENKTKTARIRPLWAEESESKNCRQIFTSRGERRIQLFGPIDEYRPTYENFIDFVRSSDQNTGKWVYNVYNDQLMQETVSLFENLKYIERTDLNYTSDWLKEYYDKEMSDYALRLAILYAPESDLHINPPYQTLPNFFFNSETIAKALKLRDEIYTYSKREQISNYIYPTGQYAFVICSNYSGWQFEKPKTVDIKYFTEDIELNSYYYGIHLMFPYWLTNEDLNKIDERYAEHYYFVHQQLLARYKLEFEQFVQKNIDFKSGYDDNFYPQLVHQNGLRFTTRHRDGIWKIDEEKLMKIAQPVTDAILKGVVTLGNLTYKVTEENHMDLLPRYIKDRFDGPMTAPVVRSILCNCDHKNYLAPSALAHPSTALRDPYYWYLMEKTFELVTLYQEKHLGPFNLSEFETDDYKILTLNNVTFSTTFQEKNNVVYELERDHNLNLDRSKIFVKQKHLNQYGVNFPINFVSEKEGVAIIRVFLGPPCYGQKCWDQRDKFFRLDAFKTPVNEGFNSVFWFLNYNPDTIDSEHDFQRRMFSTYRNYTMFLFPHRLVLPKGTVDGLNGTILVMITADENYGHARRISYNDYITYVDEKPLGFPFHQNARNVNMNATNYRFFNISIVHLEDTYTDANKIFSTYLQ